jgi:hypothetical protein
MATVRVWRANHNETGDSTCANKVPMRNLIQMRPIAFLLVLLILFFLTQPCQDVLGAPRSSSGENAFSQTSEDEDCDEGEDGCSPFCTCSCRQAPAGYFSVVVAREPKVLMTPTCSLEVEYDSLATADSANSIWQPPKH